MKILWLCYLLLDPYCFATQGGSKTLHSEPNSFLIDWSIGQPMSTPLLDKGYPIMISSGFLQNKNCDRCLYKSLDSFLIPLKIGPNPVEQVLQIQMKQAGVVWEGLDIYTTEGFLLHREKTSQNGLSIYYTISFNRYPKGWYFLKFYFLVDGVYPISRTFKIYKS